MKKNLRTLLGVVFLLTAVSAPVGCQSEAEQKLEEKEKELAELRQLAEMDRREMENEYAQFAAQYNEMKKGIRDDSLLARLDAEQRRAESLMKELKELKNSSASEILRLKRELETVRAVLRDYIRQVDSLQQLNQQLIGERDEALAEAQRRKEENNTISERNADLTEQVAIAAQLNATNIKLSALKKNGKNARRCKDITNFAVDFTVSRNVTAESGNRTVYVRLMKPNRELAAPSGKFHYQDRDIDYSASKVIEYTGQEQNVRVYIPVSEFLSKGEYTVHIFIDGQMMGSGAISMSR